MQQDKLLLTFGIFEKSIKHSETIAELALVMEIIMREFQFTVFADEKPLLVLGMQTTLLKKIEEQQEIIETRNDEQEVEFKSFNTHNG